MTHACRSWKHFSVSKTKVFLRVSSFASNFPWTRPGNGASHPDAGPRNQKSLETSSRPPSPPRTFNHLLSPPKAPVLMSRLQRLPSASTDVPAAPLDAVQSDHIDERPCVIKSRRTESKALHRTPHSPSYTHLSKNILPPDQNSSYVAVPSSCHR